MMEECKAITKDLLHKGDHICSDRRRLFTYYHHGIYVGDGMVIHLKGPRNGKGKFSLVSSSSVSSKSASRSACYDSGCQNYFAGGIVITCLDCFLDGNSLYVYDYECYSLRKYVENHDCSINSPDEAVSLAYSELHRNSSGYDLFENNCEHFATYCKTNLAFSMQAIFVKAIIAGIFKLGKQALS